MMRIVPTSRMLCRRNFILMMESKWKWLAGKVDLIDLRK